MFFLLAMLAATGWVDVHVHSDPDMMPRSIDAVDAARLAKQRGARAILLKNHFEPTASLAYLTRKAVPGIEVFGAIALNRSVGGLNPTAVDRFAQTKGRYGRAVWMPTFDSTSDGRTTLAPRPLVATILDGKPVPELAAVLEVMAKHNLSLATGHLAPAETLVLIPVAKAAGVTRILVTHPMDQNMTVEQMKQCAAMGALLEFTYLSARAAMDKASSMIRAVGPAHVVLSSDFGQAGNPPHPEAFDAWERELTKRGFTRAELDQMMKTNPAKWLGLP